MVAVAPLVVVVLLVAVLGLINYCYLSIPFKTLCKSYMGGWMIADTSCNSLFLIIWVLVNDKQEIIICK